MSDPITTPPEPHAVSPDAANPYAANPYAVSPDAVNPYSQNPYAPTPYGQNPYAANPYAAPGYVPYSPNGVAYAYGPRTNPLAIASLVCALGALVFGLFASIAGVILGHIAMSQIASRGENGRGLAVAGVIIGYALGALALVGIALYVVFFVGMITTFG